jgi:hypothetical protein
MVHEQSGTFDVVELIVWFAETLPVAAISLLMVVDLLNFGHRQWFVFKRPEDLQDVAGMRSEV